MNNADAWCDLILLETVGRINSLFSLLVSGANIRRVKQGKIGKDDG